MEFSCLPSEIPTEEETVFFGAVCAIASQIIPDQQYTLDVDKDGHGVIYLETVNRQLCTFNLRHDDKWIGLRNFKSNYKREYCKIISMHSLNYNFKTECRSTNYSNLINAIRKIAPKIRAGAKLYAR